MSFYVGQKVVCVETHPQGVVKAGEIYTITGIRNNPCKCGTNQVSVNNILDPCFLAYAKWGRCPACNHVRPLVQKDCYWWFRASRFAPLESYGDSIAERIEKEIEQEQLQPA